MKARDLEKLKTTCSEHVECFHEIEGSEQGFATFILIEFFHNVSLSPRVTFIPDS